MTSKRIEASFNCDKWEENDIKALEGSTLRVTRTRTERTFTGGMKGSAVAEYTFAYYPLVNAESKPTETTDDSTEGKDCHKVPQEVTYNGLMYYKGTIEGVDGEGEVVFEINGTWGKNGVMRAIGDWKSIPGSGTGAFKDLKASGGYDGASSSMPCWVQLN